MGWNKTHSGRDWVLDGGTGFSHRDIGTLHLRIWKAKPHTWFYEVYNTKSDWSLLGTAWTKHQAQTAAYLEASKFCTCRGGIPLDKFVP